LWGGKYRYIDTKGRELFSFFEDKEIVLLNDGTGTRCNPITLELTPIDLAFCNSSLSNKIKWSVDLTSTFGSDHHVASIEFINKRTDTCMPEDNSDIIYNYKKADWKGFSTKCDITLSPDMVSQDIEETCHRLTDNILKIAGEFIPTRNRNNKIKKKPGGQKNVQSV